MEICDHCGAKSWDHDAEAIIENAVRREYERLLCSCEIKLGEFWPKSKLRSAATTSIESKGAQSRKRPTVPDPQAY